MAVPSRVQGISIARTDTGQGCRRIGDLHVHMSVHLHTNMDALRAMSSCRWLVGVAERCDPGRSRRGRRTRLPRPEGAVQWVRHAIATRPGMCGGEPPRTDDRTRSAMTRGPLRVRRRQVPETESGDGKEPATPATCRASRTDRTWTAVRSAMRCGSSGPTSTASTATTTTDGAARATAELTWSGAGLRWVDVARTSPLMSVSRRRRRWGEPSPRCGRKSGRR